MPSKTLERANILGSRMYIFADKDHFPSIAATEKLNELLKEFVTTGELTKE